MIFGKVVQDQPAAVRRDPCKARPAAPSRFIRACRGLYWAVRALTALFLLAALASPQAPAADEASVCAAYRKDNTTQASESATRPVAPPFSHGLLWRLERPGIPVSHVFGTMHVDTPALTRLPDPVRLALAASNRLIMETQLDDQAQANYSARAFLPEGETLRTRLNSALIDAYLKIAGEYAVPDDIAIRLTPWAATNLIGRPAQQSGPSMEDVLRNAATQAGKPIVALETMTELLGTLSAMPNEDQTEVLTDTICNHERVLRDADMLEEIYQRHDLAALMAFSDRDHHDPALFARYRQRMLFDRSERMVRRLLPYLSRGGAFVAVGALHLTGEHGILYLLEKQGYRISLEY